MTIEKMNENTWIIDDGFVRCFLLEGTEKAMLIDTGASSADAKKLAESVTDKPVILVNTHGDGDHVAGNGEFESFYMAKADYEKCGVDKKFPGCKCIDINDGEIMELGGRPILMAAIPGHTYGSVAILDINGRALYSGDSVQDGHIFMFGKHRCRDEFAGSLKKLIGMADRFDRIYPAHGKAELPGDFVEKVLNDWQKVLDGKLEFTMQDMHGNSVRTYSGERCGFYCDPE